jgi:AraC-like DNA-binding protein
MWINRYPGVISGFTVGDPIPGWPAFTHCSEESCDSTHFVPPHSHPVFELVYLAQGELRMEAGGRTFTQGAGDLFIASPGERHGWLERKHKPYHTLTLGVSLADVKPGGARLAARLLRERPHLLHHGHDLEPVLRGMVRQVLLRQEGFAEVVIAQMRVLVAMLEQQLRHGAAAAWGPYSLPVIKVLRHMETTLDRRIALRDMAQLAGMGPSHFIRRFEAEVGVTPAAHHLRLRLQAARLALQQPELSITAVATAHGFSSSQHLATAFRRAFDQTPMQYRRQARG